MESEKKILKKNQEVFALNKKVVLLQRRNGRAVDRGGLENRYTEMYRGFESLFLRSQKATRRVAFVL